MEAARPVPPYERRVVHGDWWYCLTCRHSEATEYAARGHFKREHQTVEDGDPTKGVDYTNGTHLRILMDRWEAWSLAAVDRFVAHVESLRGADDFALEVGEGLKDE